MLLRDLAYSARTLWKSPVFTVAIAITLALGMGASTAIFSVTNAVLLRPLPYKDPGRLVVAAGEMRKRGVSDWPFSNADFFDLQNGTESVFEDLAGVSTGRGTLPREDGTLEEVRFAGVTPNFFRMLGARIALGRDFIKTDGQPQPPQPQAAATPTQNAQRLPNIAILSY
ncbi:MAG TPA: ABC transporter permease [Bryobacteraceae bacterium]|nr:ABC transporter permease [Bryobacteraceae bacterium]